MENVDARVYIHKYNLKRIHNNNLDVKENVLVYWLQRSNMYSYI
jgi:hypothetical protein